MHSVIEGVERGKLSGEPMQVRAAIEHRWDEGIAQAEGEADPAVVTRIVAFREELPAGIRPKAGTRNATQFAPIAKPCYHSICRSLLCRRRVDTVWGTGSWGGRHDARRIVDLKNGVRQAEPSHSRLRQLMLYGYLAEVTSDNCVSEIVIEYASFTVTEWQVDVLLVSFG